MVIQTRICDGLSVKTRTYRKVYRLNYWQFFEGFMAQKAFNKWGTMSQLKGKKVILIAKFGEETEI